MSIDPTLWQRHYPAGVPTTIDPTGVATLNDLITESVAANGPSDAFTCMNASLTYDEVARHADAFATHLQREVGVRSGDRVALIMPNVLAYPVAMFGALRAGATVVNCNPLYTPRELHAQLADSGATVAVVLENMAATLERACADLDTLPHIVIARIGDLMGPRGAIVNAAVRYVKRMVPPYDMPSAARMSEVLARWDGHVPTPVEVRPDGLAFLQYTGGTTGVAKGAMLTHRNVVANVLQCHEWFRPVLGTERQVMVTALPLYHVFALTVNCLLMMRCGARNVLIVNPRDMSGFVRELRRTPFTVMTGVNTLFAHLLDAPGFERIDFSHLRLCIAGGMAAQRPVAERWQRATGRPLIEGYGLTETSPVVVCNRTDNDTFTGGIGLPIPSTELAIRDASGNDLGVGDIGELHFRGPQVMRGYWERPHETAAVLGDDGFLATGDVGTIDADGLVHVVDRVKDQIVVSGFNVYPNEIEEIAVGCPGVLEAACIGLPSDDTGEVVALYVARSDPSLTRDALLGHLRANLTGYKVPHVIEFRQELPKTPVGKVLRRAIREEVIGS